MLLQSTHSSPDLAVSYQCVPDDDRTLHQRKIAVRNSKEEQTRDLGEITD